MLSLGQMEMYFLLLYRVGLTSCESPTRLAESWSFWDALSRVCTAVMLVVSFWRLCRSKACGGEMEPLLLIFPKAPDSARTALPWP